MSRGKLSWMLLLLLIAALYAALSAVTPLYLDDWTFLGNWRDDAANASFSFGGLWRYYEFIRGYDNGRFANLLSPIFSLYTPFRQLFPILTGLAMAFTVAMAVKFARLKAPSVLALAVVWAMMIIFMPWFDTLFVADYSLNYIWGGAITLALLQCLMKLSWGRFPCWVLSIAAVLAVIAGGWHEGFAVPTVCGLTVMAFLKRGRLNRWFYVILAIYAISTVAFMLSPGMLGRIGAAASSEFSFPYIRSYLIGVITLACYIVWALFSAGRNQIKDIWSENLFKVLAVICISAYLLGFFSTRTPRSFYYADLLAIILFVKLVFTGLNFNKVKRKSIFASLSAILILACTAQSMAAIVWQTRYTEDWEAIIDQLEAGGNGSVFYDISNPSRAPFYTLGMPVSHAWHNPYHYRALQSYYLTPVLGVVPPALKNVDYDHAIPLAPGSKVRRYGDYLISPFEKLDTTTEIIIPVSLSVQEGLEHGLPAGRNFLSIPFITLGGDTLLYYQR